MTIVGKAVASVATLGTIGGSAFLANHFLSNSDTVSARLVSEGFDIDVGSSWQTILSAHNAVQNTKDTFKTEDNTDLKIEELQANCKSALDSKKDNEDIYKKARQWCVKEREIKNIFESLNLRELDVDQTTDDQVAWKAKETDLKGEPATATKIKEEMKDAGTINLAKIKEGCKVIVSAKTTGEGFNEKLELAKKWCAVPKNQ